MAEGTLGRAWGQDMSALGARRAAANTSRTVATAQTNSRFDSLGLDRVIMQGFGVAEVVELNSHSAATAGQRQRLLLRASSPRRIPDTGLAQYELARVPMSTPFHGMPAHFRFQYRSVRGIDRPAVGWSVRDDWP